MKPSSIRFNSILKPRTGVERHTAAAVAATTPEKVRQSGGWLSYFASATVNGSKKNGFSKWTEKDSRTARITVVQTLKKMSFHVPCFLYACARLCTMNAEEFGLNTFSIHWQGIMSNYTVWHMVTSVHLWYRGGTIAFSELYNINLYQKLYFIRLFSKCCSFKHSKVELLSFSLFHLVNFYNNICMKKIFSFPSKSHY